MITINKNICKQHGPCTILNVCPVQAISVDAQGIPDINQELCLGCRKCVKMCQYNALQFVKDLINSNIKINKTNNTMKIAIPTRENMVDNHFGHCDHYTIYTVDGQNITAQETLPSPQGCGCKSNIAAVLQQMGVTIMLAGNMGDGAKNVLETHAIQVIRGCSGATSTLIDNYLKGNITDSGTGCEAHHQHQGDHQCSHHQA